MMARKHGEDRHAGTLSHAFFRRHIAALLLTAAAAGAGCAEATAGPNIPPLATPVVLADGGNVELRSSDDRRAAETRPGDIQIPSATSPAVAPDASETLAIAAAAGLAGLLIPLLVIGARKLLPRRAIGSQRSHRREKVAAAPDVDPPLPARAANDRNARITVAELAEAVGAARISRVLLAGTPGANGAGGVTLARRLAAMGASTILVDFGAGGEAARRMGSLDPIEDVEVIASSPTTFAHAIQRDRGGPAHCLAAAIEFQARREDDVLDAASAVLSALGEVYARTVVVVGSMSAADLVAMMDENTAIVVPVEAGEEVAALATLDRLAAEGLSEVLLLVLDAALERTAAA